LLFILFDSPQIYDDKVSVSYSKDLGLVRQVMEGAIPAFDILIGAHIGGIDVLEIYTTDIPHNYNMLNIYPSPFNNMTTVKLNIPFTQQIQISMYDFLENEVLQLTNSRFEAGIHAFQINGDSLLRGVCIVKAASEDDSESVKIVLLT